jgi:hypothetical protein
MKRETKLPSHPGAAEVGVVVMGGVAAVVSGASGTTVSVIVSPVVTSDGVTGPGIGGSALLVSLKATATAPTATTALAPIVPPA